MEILSSNFLLPEIIFKDFDLNINMMSILLISRIMSKTLYE